MIKYRTNIRRSTKKKKPTGRKKKEPTNASINRETSPENRANNNKNSRPAPKKLTV